jgi:hypothetical protein
MSMICPRNFNITTDDMNGTGDINSSEHPLEQQNKQPPLVIHFNTIKTTAYDVWNLGPVLWQVQKCDTAKAGYILEGWNMVDFHTMYSYISIILL